MNRPKVSIIVPVYKASVYLDSCVQSLLGQTLEDIEIILVDDGSPDESPQLCDGYAAQDRRVRAIHQKNAGVSAARNSGLRAAKADWVTFVDSDDWLEPDAVEILYRQTEKTGCDLVMAFHLEERPDQQAVLPAAAAEGEFPIDSYGNALLKGVFLPASKFPGLFPEELHGLPLLAYPFAKLYFRRTLLEKRITFPDGVSYGEDKIFNIQAIRAAKKVCFSSRPVYHYRIRSGSLSTNAGTKACHARIRLLEEMEELLQRLKLDPEVEHAWHLNVVTILLALTELFGMDRKKVGLSRHGMELRKFRAHPLCRKALADVRLEELPGMKHRVLLWLLSRRLYKLSIFLCVLFYLFFPKKNLLKGY